MFLSCAQDKVLISLAIQVSLQVLDDIDTEELDISIKQRDIRLILCYIANAFLMMGQHLLFGQFIAKLHDHICIYFHIMQKYAIWADKNSVCKKANSDLYKIIVSMSWSGQKGGKPYGKRYYERK